MKFCGRSGPTGTFGNSVPSAHKPRPQGGRGAQGAELNYEPLNRGESCLIEDLTSVPPTKPRTQVVLVVELVHLQGRQARPIEHHPLAQMCHSLCSRSSCCCHERCYDSLKLSDKLSELVPQLLLLFTHALSEPDCLKCTVQFRLDMGLSWLDRQSVFSTRFLG